MIKKQILFIFKLFIFINLTVYSQPNRIVFEHISIEQGLSQSSVYSIYKDSKGFMWFGTAEGLNRYDGNKFVVYNVDLEKSNAVSDSWITCIYEDSYQNLWIGTRNGGLNLFNYHTEEFAAYKTDKQNTNSISNNTINAITEGEKGVLWIATNNGLNKLDLRNIKNYVPIKQPFTRYEKIGNNNLINSEIISLCYTKRGDIWIGTRGGGFAQLSQKSDGSEFFINYKNQINQLNSTCNNDIFSILQDVSNEEILWIINSTDIEKFNIKTKQFLHYNKYPEATKLLSDIRFSVNDKKGNLWIGTYEKGLIKFDTKTEKFYRYYHSKFDVSTLSDNNVLSIYEDDEGIIWVGTKGAGVNKQRNNKFVQYRNSPDDPNSLNGEDVWAVYKDKSGVVWVGTELGLNKLNRKTDEFFLYKYDEKNPKSLSRGGVYSILEDKDGDFWIGTVDGGLSMMDRDKGTFKNYVNNPEFENRISYNYVRTIVEDDEGFLWIGTRGGGLNKFDKKKGTFKQFKHIPNNSNSLSHDRINAMLLDKNGFLWIGTSSGGLNKFDRKTETFTHYNADNKKPNSLNDQFIMSLCEDNEGNLWVGAYDGGLNLFDRDKETFKHYTMKDGLPNNVIYGILEDKKGNLWLSTNKGLSQFNPGNQKFVNYDISDGLQDNEFNSGSSYKSPDGEMLFGGINGFNIFWPEKIDINPVIPPIVFTELRIINKKIVSGSESPLKTSITTSNEINLSYRDYIFSIEFVALSFISPGKNKYACKLEGFDKDWITTDHQNRIATYTNLKGGTYTFRVKASNNDGVWNEAGTSIKINIDPPWWKNRWFYFFVIVFLIVFLVAFYRWRISSLRTRQMLLEKTVKEKTTEVVLQKEELQAVNEELTASNEEMYNQREELESTLSTLQSAQNQLIQSEKMAGLGILAAGVAHEINNPLNFIQGGVFILERYFHDNLKDHLDKVAPILDGIIVGVQRTSAIVGSLNHYSRQDVGLREACNIQSIIDNCLVMLQSETKNRIEIEKNYTPLTYSLMGNEGKLHQAMLNILSNACHAIEKKGNISISTSIEADKLNISITDNGCGISKHILNKIMDPFFTTKEPGKGTGLGLSITYNIIMEHNGTIEYKSEPSKGTQALIKLPIS